MFRVSFSIESHRRVNDVMSWFYSLPLFAGAAIFCSFYMAVSILGGIYIRRKVHAAELKANHDIAGFTFGVVGVVYAVLLGFVVINVWEDFSSSQELCEDEANRIINVYRDVSVLPGAERVAIHHNLRSYADSIVKEEWKDLAEGKESKNVERLLNETWNALHSARVTTDKEKIFYQSAISRLSDADNLRAKRILSSRRSLHPLLYLALIAGGMLSTAFVYFFAHERMFAQILIIGSLSFIVSLFIFLIITIDNPFVGNFSIKPDAMEHAIRVIDDLER